LQSPGRGTWTNKLVPKPKKRLRDCALRFAEGKFDLQLPLPQALVFLICNSLLFFSLATQFYYNNLNKAVQSEFGEYSAPGLGLVEKDSS